MSFETYQVMLSGMELHQLLKVYNKERFLVPSKLFIAMQVPKIRLIMENVYTFESMGKQFTDRGK